MLASYRPVMASVIRTPYGPILESGITGIKRALDGQDEFRFAKRLLERDSVRPPRQNLFGIPADEQVRNKSAPKDLVDSRNAVTFPQLRIGDDEVRPTSKGGHYGPAFRRLHATSAVANFRERLDEKHGYQGIVFDQEYP